MARQYQPPEKKRKPNDSFDDDFWGDDNEVFSQAVLEDIDHIIQSQQAPGNGEANNNGGRKFPDTTGFTGRKISMTNSAQSNKSLGYHTLPNGQAFPSTDSNKQNATYTSQSKYNSKPSLQTCPPPAPNSALGNVQKPETCATAQSSTSGGQLTYAMKEKLKEVEEENKFLKDENQKLKGAQYGKDGQIKYLRTKLAQLESEKFKERQDKMQKLEEQSKEQEERERKLDKDAEKLRTMLQFKDHEIEELKERCRRQDRQLRSSDGNSPVRPTFQSPVKTRGAPSSPRTPSASGSNFPNKASFMNSEVSPRKENGSRRTKIEIDKGTQVSTPDTLSALEKPKIRRPHLLKINSSKGKARGSQLVAKLVENIETKVSEESDGAISYRWDQGIFSLMQHPVTVMDMSLFRLERDLITLTFKPQHVQGEAFIQSADTTTCVQDVDIRETVLLAQQTLTNLLNEAGYDSSVEESAITSQSQVVLLLPLIETLIDSYLQAILSLNKTTPTNSGDSATTSASSKNSIDSSVSALSAGVSALQLKGASYVNDVEARTVCALQVLYKLVIHSNYVRLVLFCDKHYDSMSFTEQSEDQPGTSEVQHMDKDEILSQLCQTARQVAGNCDLLNKLLTLANPLEYDNSLRNVWITCGAMRVLSVLSMSAFSRVHSRLLPLFTQESLLNALNSENYLQSNGCIRSPTQLVSMVTCTIQLLTSLIQASELYLQNLCSQDEDCLLLSLYHTCVHTIKSLEVPAQRQAICHKMYVFLGTLLATHRRGSSVFTQRSCHCSSQVIKCLVITMLRELEVFMEATHTVHSNTTDTTLCLVSSGFWPFLHQGMVTLHALTMRDALFTSHHEDECKHDFVRLMCGIHRLLSSLPSTMSEKDLLLDLMPDLWDLDMDYPESADAQLNPELFRSRNSAATSMRD